MDIKVFTSMAEVPQDLFNTLVTRLTYWERNWLMRPTAERLRRAQKALPVAVAYKENTPVGWVLVESLMRSEALLQMFVDEAHRRQGIAKALVMQLANHLGESVTLAGHADGCRVISRTRC